MTIFIDEKNNGDEELFETKTNGQFYQNRYQNYGSEVYEVSLI